MSTVAQAAWALLAVLITLTALYIYHREGDAWRAAAAALVVGKAAAVTYALAGLDVTIAHVLLVNKKTGATHAIAVTAVRVMLVANAATLAAMWAAGLLRPREE